MSRSSLAVIKLKVHPIGKQMAIASILRQYAIARFNSILVFKRTRGLTRRRVRLALAVFVLLPMTGCIGSKSDSPSGIGSPDSSSLNILTEASREKLILFVHGVFGDPSPTWKNRDGLSWPEMMQQDRAFTDFTIGSMSYDTPLFARTSGIEEIATRLLRKLEDEDVFKKYKEIYFISHSMGGLVTKRILVDLNRPSQVEKLRRVKAVLYISTPAQGADRAEIASWLSLNPQLQDMRAADLNSFLQGLENQWQNLIRDRNIQLFPRSFCAYETKPTHGVRIVTRVYAATSCDQNPFPVDADHENIVKPVSQTADVYTWTRARIHEATNLATESPPHWSAHNYKATNGQFRYNSCQPT